LKPGVQVAEEVDLLNTSKEVQEAVEVVIQRGH
jgi:hypothetical protein